MREACSNYLWTPAARVFGYFVKKTSWHNRING